MATVDPARIKPWIGDPPRAQAPELAGYRQVAHERFDIVRGSVAGVVLLPFWAFLFVAVIALLGGRDSYGADITLVNAAGGLFTVLIAVPVLHEAVHGLTAMLCGAKPSYGVGPGFAYTTFREPIPRNPYLAIGLAPLIVLSVLCVVIAVRWDAAAGWLVFFAVVNAGGAIGDLWMSWRIVRQPRSAVFYDLADGFAVLVPDETPNHKEG